MKLVRGNKTLEEGADLSLYCNATGFPDPSVTWTKGGVDVPIARNSWLNFTNINGDKAGDYACNGNNTCGKKSSAAISIDVQCKNSLHLTLSKVWYHPNAQCTVSYKTNLEDATL